MWSAPWGLHWMAMKLRERRIFKRHAVFHVPYEEYIRSPDWQAKARFFKEAHPWCGVCNQDWKKRGGHLETHHLTYERLGHEAPTDLINLCDADHPIGAYSLREIRADRRRYLCRKYRLWLFPPYWFWRGGFWLAKALREIVTGAR